MALKTTEIFLIFGITFLVLPACTNKSSFDGAIEIKPGLYAVEGTMANGPLSDKVPASEQCLGIEESKTSLKEILEEFETNKECKTFGYSQIRDQKESNFSCKVKDIGNTRGRITHENLDNGYNISINGTITIHGKRYLSNIYINGVRIGDCTIKIQ